MEHKGVDEVLYNQQREWETAQEHYASESAMAEAQIKMDDEEWCDIFEKGYKAGYDKALAQLADMTEECKQMGRREVVERYKKDNPSFYKKYRAYWKNLEKEWGIE